MRYLITGAAGFIGRNLAKALKEDPTADIIGLDKVELSNEALTFFHEFIKQDIACLTQNDVEVIIDNYGIDIIYHLAAIPTPSLYVTKPFTTIQNNLSIGMTILLAAIKQRKPIIYTSTSEIYGSYPDEMVEDGLRILGTPGSLRWVYSDSKAILEHILFSAKKELGYDDFIIFRVFNTVGKGIDKLGSGRVFTSMLGSAIKNKEILVTGSGEQTRCFCHIDDIINWMCHPFRKGYPCNFKAMKGEAFNIGNPENEISMLELAKKLVEKMKEIDSKLADKIGIRRISHDEFYGGKFDDVMSRKPCIDKVISATFIKPKISLGCIINQMTWNAYCEIFNKESVSNE